jgi:hypothetical protein
VHATQILPNSKSAPVSEQHYTGAEEIDDHEFSPPPETPPKSPDTQVSVKEGNSAFPVTVPLYQLMCSGFWLQKQVTGGLGGQAVASALPSFLTTQLPGQLADPRKKTGTAPAFPFMPTV